MNELPRQILVKLIARHGRTLTREPRRLEGLLRDYASQHRREIAVLLSALEEGVVRELLLVGTRQPGIALLLRLARRLQDHVAMEESAAKWSVNSWALALSLISDVELAAFEQGRSEPASTATSVSTPVATGQAATMASTKGKVVAAPSPHGGMVLIVSAAGEGDFKDLNSALQAAPPGARLRIKPGIYHESVVLDKMVEIVGEGPRADIILNSAAASCLSLQTPQAIVRGLTIRQEPTRVRGAEYFAVDIVQGQVTLEDCDISSRSSACLGIHNHATAPQIRRCRIYAGSVGGVYFFDEAEGTLEECDIYDNDYVGVGITGGAHPVIRRCTIRQGKHVGVRSRKGGRGLLEDCEIFENEQGNINVSEAAALTLHRCRIYGGPNVGVAIHQSGSAALEDCDLYNHPKPAISLSQGAQLVALRCTIHEGKSTGVFIGPEGMGNLEQCNIFSNADAGIHLSAKGVAALRQCQINHNAGAAVRVENGGAVDAEGCDLTGNLDGAWELATGAQVASRNNWE